MKLSDKDYARLEELLQKAWYFSLFEDTDAGISSTCIHIEHEGNPGGDDSEADSVAKELCFLFMKICGFRDAIKKARLKTKFSLGALCEDPEDWIKELPPDFRDPAWKYLELGLLDKKGDSK